MKIIETVPGYYKFCYDDDNNKYIVYIYDFDDIELEYPTIVREFDDEKRARGYIRFMYNVCKNYYDKTKNKGVD